MCSWCASRKPPEYDIPPAPSAILTRRLDAGYVVLEPDLRGHGDSDPDPSQSTDLEMGSSWDDAIAAIERFLADKL